MELRQVAYVVAVVDEGGFTHAARVLHVSQSALSQGVRSLERELGTALFERLGRTVVLTPAGAAFVRSARPLLRDADAAREAVAAVRGLTAGTLDVVALPTLAADPLAGLLASFRRRYPTITIRVAEPESLLEALERVRDGSCDVGLVELTDDAHLDGLAAHVLGTQELVAVAAPEQAPRRAGKRAPIRELAPLPLLTTPPGTSTRRLVEEAFAEAGLAVQPAIETAHREALLPLALSGAGVCFLPETSAARAAAEGAVVVHLDPPLRRTVGLVHRDGPAGPAAGAFVAVATAVG